MNLVYSMKSKDNDLTITTLYNDDNNISSIEIELSDVQMRQRIRKLSQKIARKNTVSFMNALKDIGNNYPSVRVMYDFIKDSGLFEKFLIAAAIDCRKVNIKLDINCIEFLTGVKNINTMKLWFGGSENTIMRVTLQLDITEDNLYCCRFIDIIKDEVSLTGKGIIVDDFTTSFLENPKNSDAIYIESAVYRNYHEYSGEMLQSINRVLNAFVNGTSYDDNFNGKYPNSCKYDQYYAEAILEADTINYKGTYFIEDKPVCNLYRTFTITNKKELNFISSVEYNRLYNMHYNIHSLLFRNYKSEAQYNKFLPMHMLLTSETLEYEKEFYSKYSYIIEDLPGTKNYYYDDGFILEVNSIEFEGNGRQLKQTKYYYKLFKNTCWDKPEEAYIIIPDLKNNYNNTLYMIFKTEQYNPSVKSSDYMSILSEEAKINKEKIEKVISDACQQVGVQYK